MSFKVPEAQRILVGPMASDFTNGKNGAFRLPSVIAGRTLVVIASDGSEWKAANLPGDPWEHVSARAMTNGKDLTPTWIEMCQIKAVFWDEDDVVIQYHPAKSSYVNVHPHVLHLWRPIGVTLPMPPVETI